MAANDVCTLFHIRAHYVGGSAQNLSCERLAASPGRARGRVLAWGYRRLAGFLSTAARRGFVMGSCDAVDATGSERALLDVIDAVRAGDPATAKARAQWIVPTARVQELLRLVEAVCERAPTARAA